MAEGWRYYNHAFLPECAPHEMPDVTQIGGHNFWKNKSGIAFLARWTSDFDCSQEQNWWYVIKDDVFDISALKAKRRYEINKGKKKFTVNAIEPSQYVSELVEIHVKAYEEYPAQYRPIVDEDKLSKEISHWNGNVKIFGAFSSEDARLCGFAMILEEKEYANFAMLKVIPECEKEGINAGLVAGILEHYSDRIANGYYICDGERALFHETHFQDYLEKYFGFRKAYAKLHVKFRFPFSLAVKLLRPMKKVIEKQDAGIMKKIGVVLLYDELVNPKESGEK